jgi:hypothetical protein
MEKLAIFGGPKVKTTPFGTGKRFVLEAPEKDTVFYVFGNQVKDMEAKLRGMYGMKHCNG